MLAALAPLVSEGIVARDGAGYVLVRESLREVTKDLPQPAQPDRRSCWA